MADVIKSKGAVLSVLDIIANALPKTQRDALIAVKRWVSENASEGSISEEAKERLKRIFEGSKEQQEGKKWIEREQSDPAYKPGFPHKMIHKPADRAELTCRWYSKTGRWEPCEPWPIVQHRVKEQHAARPKKVK